MFDLVVVDRQQKTVSSSLASESSSSVEGGSGEAAIPDDGESEASVTVAATATSSAAVHHHHQYLDIVRTFSPRPLLLCITIKLFLAAWILAILTMSIDQATYPNFWLAYLTHWGLTVTAMYGVMSPICAIYLAYRPPITNLDTLSCCGAGGGGGVVGCLIKTTWAYLAIVVPAEVMITILFWALEYESGDAISYVTVMVHGGTVILLFIDGFVVSRIPLRLKQFVFFETFSFLYLLWNVLRAYPSDVVSQDDDAIYLSNIVLFLVVLLVANPIIFGICWWLSRLLPLRLRADVIV
ncbi:hypothetical protein ACHAWU_007605 [Discostella pseudostelligera]|uniref:Transmembrane protein n=1 Tax=Discostella pseudostelligera TaxID=259834 RepID=A0ABD3MD60_9STRA